MKKLLTIITVATIPAITLHYNPVVFAYLCIPYIALSGILIAKIGGKK